MFESASVQERKAFEATQLEEEAAAAALRERVAVAEDLAEKAAYVRTSATETEKVARTESDRVMEMAAGIA